MAQVNIRNGATSMLTRFADLLTGWRSAKELLAARREHTENLRELEKLTWLWATNGASDHAPPDGNIVLADERMP
jgi:hypothetical protein